MAEYDVFLSHFWGDDALAQTLMKELQAAGLSVWYDGVEIKTGDSIIGKMQEGIQRSWYGLILFTTGFLSTESGFRWGEVDTYIAEQLATGQTSLLPIVAGLDHNEFQRRMPLLKPRRYERLTLNKNGRPSKSELKRVVQAISDATTMRANVQMLGRDELNAAIGGLEDRLPHVREQLMVSGNDCKAIVESKSGFLLRAIKRGVRVKVMCVDPLESSAVETLVRVDPRFDDAEDFTSSMTSVDRVLKKLRTEDPERFEFRYMPVAPSVGLYITDPGLPTSSMKVELYTPKPWSPADTRPHLIIKNDGLWHDYFMSSWTNYWAMSRVP